MRYHDYVRTNLDNLLTKTEAQMFEEVKKNDWKQEINYYKIYEMYERMFPSQPFQGWNQCPKCGIKLEGVMGYCCANIDCPTGLGPIVC